MTVGRGQRGRAYGELKPARSVSAAARAGAPAAVYPDATAAVRPDATAAVYPDATAAVRPDATAAVRPDATAAVRPDAMTAVRPGAMTAVRPGATAAARSGATAASRDSLAAQEYFSAPRGWLRTLRDAWPRVVCRLLESGESAVVRVLMAEVRGSAPREAGTCMVVTPTETYGTIGGGNLEWQALRSARALLASGSTSSVEVRRLVLGRELAQCCGGVVRLWIERFTQEDLPFLRRIGQPATAILTEVSARGVMRKLITRGAHESVPRLASPTGDRTTLLEPLEKRRPALWLYGAGHVGQALIHIMGDLPFDVTWIDSRAGLLPTPLPDNVRSLYSQAPVNTTDSAPPGTLFLVMTHDHGLDYELCRRILERRDLGWLGLIGSKSKGARFRSRLARDGVAPEQIARLTCPIGIDGVNSKLPAAIAVGIAAQLLRGVGASAPALADREHALPGILAVEGDACTSSNCEACSARASQAKPAES